MFSKHIFNRLLQLKYRSVCCRNCLINRQLIDHTHNLNRCLSRVPETNQIIIEEKINKFAEKAVSSQQRRDGLQEMDVNDKELMDLIGNRHINALSETPDTELLDEISPTLGNSFNLAAFADKSETLQMFIKLGVDLSYIEKKSPETAEDMLKLDFETEIKPYIRFLVDNGIKPEDLGIFFTNNPFIFGQHLDDLEIRIKYLKSKKFSEEMIASVIRKAPKFLNFATKAVDYRLGLLQKDFTLSANELRGLVTRYPKIALFHEMSFQNLKFIFKEEFGFNSNEIKEILLIYPKLFRSLLIQKDHRQVVKVFDLVHNEMKIPHELIAKTPEILNRRISQIEWKHLYLKKLGRDQYDPKLPLYVPLSAFYSIEDNIFCEKYTKTSIQDFNLFLKSL